MAATSQKEIFQQMVKDFVSRKNIFFFIKKQQTNYYAKNIVFIFKQKEVNGS